MIESIKKQIKEVVDDEAVSHRLAVVLRDISKDTEANSTDEDIAGVVKFISEYIDHVPALLEEGFAKADKLGLGDPMNKMFGVLEIYWMDENDLIPDRLGMMGLVDDAYASMMLLQGVSDYCKATCDYTIMKHDFSKANQGIRKIIGESIADPLDLHVANTIANSLVGKIAQQFSKAGLVLGDNPNRILGDATPAEVARERLGAIGIAA